MPQERKNFGKLREVIPPPNLIENQIFSFNDFLQLDVPASARKNVGLTQDLRRVPDSRIMAAELKEKSRTLGRDIDSLAARLDVRTRELKAKTIAAAHELAQELARRAEALKEAAATKADVAQETMVELRGLLNQAASHLETLRRADAGSAA